MRQLLESSRSPIGKALNALDFPMPRAPIEPIPAFSTDLIAWDETAGEPGFHKDSDIPLGHIRWGLAATGDAWTFLHLEPNGLGAFIDPLTGVKVWIIIRDNGSLLQSTTFLHHQNLDLHMPRGNHPLEVIVLKPGTRL